MLERRLSKSSQKIYQIVPRVKSKQLIKKQNNLTQKEMEELQQLAPHIGIDIDNEFDEFEGFLNNVIKTDLPIGWSKIEDKQGKITYYNSFEKIQTKIHPLVKKFRLFFHDYLTARTKEPKKNQIIESHNNLEAESPISLKRKSKFTNSFSPLKKENLVIPLYDEGNSKTRYLELAKCLETKKKTEEKNFNNISILDEYEKALQKSKFYYYKKYGNDLLELYDYITTTGQYKKADPMEVAKSILFFKIHPTDIHLFWIARLYSSLELPEYWSANCENEREGKYYIPPDYLIKIFMHPSYYYIESLLEIAKISKQKPEEFNNLNYKMKFYDLFERDYDIDMINLVNDLRENKQPNKLMKYTTTNELFNYKEDENNIYHLDDDQSDEIWNEEILKFKEKLIERNMSDLHIYEVSNQININFEKEFHLIIFVSEFIRTKDIYNKDNISIFRLNMKGQPYWIQRGKPPSHIYPYLDELKERIQTYKLLIQEEFSDVSINKQSYIDSISKIIDTPIEIVKTKIQNERIRYIKKILKENKIDLQKLLKDFQVNNLVNVNNDTKEQYFPSYINEIFTNETIKKNISKDLYDILFPSCFNIQDFLKKMLFKRMKKKNNSPSSSRSKKEVHNIFNETSLDFINDTSYEISFFKHKMNTMAKFNIKGLGMTQSRYYPNEQDLPDKESSNSNIPNEFIEEKEGSTVNKFKENEDNMNNNIRDSFQRSFSSFNDEAILNTPTIPTKDIKEKILARERENSFKIIQVKKTMKIKINNNIKEFNEQLSNSKIKKNITNKKTNNKNYESNIDLKKGKNKFKKKNIKVIKFNNNNNEIISEKIKKEKNDIIIPNFGFDQKNINTLEHVSMIIPSQNSQSNINTINSLQSLANQEEITKNSSPRNIVKNILKRSHTIKEEEESEIASQIFLDTGFENEANQDNIDENDENNYFHLNKKIESRSSNELSSKLDKLDENENKSNKIILKKATTFGYSEDQENKLSDKISFLPFIFKKQHNLMINTDLRLRKKNENIFYSPSIKDRKRNISHHSKKSSSLEKKIDLEQIENTVKDIITKLKNNNENDLNNSEDYEDIDDYFSKLNKNKNTDNNSKRINETLQINDRLIEKEAINRIISQMAKSDLKNSISISQIGKLVFAKILSSKEKYDFEKKKEIKKEHQTFSDQIDSLIKIKTFPNIKFDTITSRKSEENKSYVEPVGNLHLNKLKCDIPKNLEEIDFLLIKLIQIKYDIFDEITQKKITKKIDKNNLIKKNINIIVTLKSRILNNEKFKNNYELLNNEKRYDKQNLIFTCFSIIKSELNILITESLVKNYHIKFIKKFFFHPSKQIKNEILDPRYDRLTRKSTNSETIKNLLLKLKEIKTEYLLKLNDSDFKIFYEKYGDPIYVTFKKTIRENGIKCRTSKYNLLRMATRIGINIKTEPDLFWISYIYCNELIEKTPNFSLMNEILKKKIINQDYYFLTLIQITKIRKLIFESFEKHNQIPYYEEINNSWLVINVLNYYVYWNFKNGEKRSDSPFKFDLLYEYYTEKEK